MGYEIDRRGSEIICPCCDYEFSDSWEYSDAQNEQEIQCGECEKWFYLYVEYEVTYKTKRIQPDNTQQNNQKVEG